MFMILWVILSLVAEIKVAKLANEIISSLLTILFTAGTYISSIISSKYPSLEVIEKTYNNIHNLEEAISKNSQILSDIMPTIIVYICDKLFLYILPFLCISIFNITIISAKEYWFKKYGGKEFWEQI